MAATLSTSAPAPATEGAANTMRRRPVVMPETPARIPTTADFVTTDIEYYLGNDGIAYVRPGLRVKVNSITIGSDRRPLIDVSITDNFGNPLDRSGRVTPGAISLSFILAHWDPAMGRYTAYTTRTQTAPANSPRPGASAVQASADSGGTWTDLESGHATYKFRTALPAGFDQTRTHTLGIYGARNLTDVIGKTYYANLEHDFRPDGAAVTAKWDRINQTTSCLNCHDELAFHGGSRRNVKLCVLCHSPQTVDPDTGESQDMAVITHKIHRGANLPSVKAGKPYIIIGHNQSVHDYSHVVYPQDIRNCDNCHEGTGAASTKPSQSHIFFSQPTRGACGACHDDINWVTGAGHVAGPALDDTACATCHQPDGPEFGPSVKGAHTIPLKSAQLAGIKVQVVSTSNMKTGEKPTAVFKVTNNMGEAIDPTKIATFSPILAGPTTSYRYYWRENARTAGKFDPATGNTTYTFTKAIPADEKGTWTISADVYRNVTIKRADGEADIAVRESAMNPIHYVALNGGKATPRRAAVDMAKCNKCHDSLALHGGQRMVMDECVICHNPTITDVAVRPATAGAPESVSMQYMIHKIHAGAHLQNGYTVYGHMSSIHDYSHVEYVGALQNCTACHINGSEQLPPPVTADAVHSPHTFFSPMGAGTAACLGCHDSRDAAAHAFLNTATFPGSTTPAEACASCHGPNSQWSVDKVHAK
jgi:OmcA/MtrC family decaheme c-type cytochrome